MLNSFNIIYKGKNLRPTGYITGRPPNNVLHTFGRPTSSIGRLNKPSRVGGYRKTSGDSGRP